MSRQLAVAAFAVVLIADSAGGQGVRGLDVNETRKVRFGIGGGATIPRTNPAFQDVLTGSTGQAYVLLRVSPTFPAIRIGADFSRMKFGDPSGAIGNEPVGSTRTQLGGIASLRFDLAPGPVRPYLLAGVGAFNLRDVIDENGSLDAEALSSTQVGFDAGAGLSFRMGRIAGFVETRVQNLYTRTRGLIDTKSIQSFPITFGVIF